jgi:hypothetical protein
MLAGCWLQNAQTAADADAQAAAIKVKMLTKQAAEQKKSLASKNKEAVQLQGELAAAQEKLQKATTRLQVGVVVNNDSATRQVSAWHQ